MARRSWGWIAALGLVAGFAQEPQARADAPATTASIPSTVSPLAPPWSDPATLPLRDVVSAQVLLDDQAVFDAPSAGANRRGSVARDVFLPVYGAQLGSGCDGRWIAVGAFAWVCETGVALSNRTPIAVGVRAVAETADGLPWRYYFVGRDGSFGYKRLETAEVGEPDVQLEPGFAVAVTTERGLDGHKYGLTKSGVWVPMRDLGLARTIAFQGAELPAVDPQKPFPVAWVVVDRSYVLSKPATFARTSTPLTRFQAVPVLEVTSSFSGTFLRIGDGQWVAAKDVRHPTLAPPPPEIDVDAGEHWIDVELETQTLVAYEGARPAFATIVSTGRGRQGTSNATPKGTHRIWIKLNASSMDNLEDEGASRLYRMEDVPYVQYFAKAVGLHGTFWHRSFGHVRSHGCVNLAPLDAQRLFGWTSPRLPAGWTAAAPTAVEPGTVIRVR